MKYGRSRAAKSLGRKSGTAFGEIGNRRHGVIRDWESKQDDLARDCGGQPGTNLIHQRGFRGCRLDLRVEHSE